MKIKNPFVISGYKGAEYFCDREDETARICQILENEGNITLLAPRRFGKTGLILRVFDKLASESDWTTIYIDIFGTQNLSDFTLQLARSVLGKLDSPLEKLSAAAKRLIQGIRPTLSYDDAGKPAFSFDVISTSSEQTLEQIFQYLSSRKKRVVIAIDEFQQINEYPEKGVEATLRSYVQFSNVQFIFCGSKQHLMREMFISPKRPFYQSTTLVALDVIAPDAYFAFANAFFTAENRQFSREVFDNLYQRFSGVTWYIQVILWDLFANGGNVETVEQIDVAIRSRVEANAYEQQRLLNLLPDGSRRLLRAIALDGNVKEPQSSDFIKRHSLRAASSVKSALQSLLANEFVYQSSRGYVVYDFFLAEWLRMRG